MKAQKYEQPAQSSFADCRHSIILHTMPIVVLFVKDSISLGETIHDQTAKKDIHYRPERLTKNKRVYDEFYYNIQDYSGL